jgi:glycosyltransferase involved in cell wall biosynthesis
MNNPELVTVIPVYNESANIESVVAGWVACFKGVGAEGLIILLNDGSKDNTAEILERIAAAYGPKVRVVNKSNSGHGRSCRAGYELALELEPSWVFQIDSDGQCDPVYFNDIWTGREEFDCIFGMRTVRDDGLGRVFVTTGCRMLLRLITGTYMRDANLAYRLMRSSILRAALPKVPADFDIQNIALTLALRRLPNVRWKYVPIRFLPRRGGENSINFQKIIRMGLRMLCDLRRVG